MDTTANNLSLRVLALEPWFGGSHEAFLDGWRRRSRHEWTLATLPPRKWKWRMRQAAVTLAGRTRELVDKGEGWDLIFASDMLNLAEFKGLAPRAVRGLPTVAYFHENQLTYPVDHPSEFDYHFAFTNFTTALAATRVWWNSAFHRDSMLEGLAAFFKRMPDHRPNHAIEQIIAKSEVRHPGIEPLPPRPPREKGPLHILWAARWEADKDPETFFGALEILETSGVDFRVTVIGGGTARSVPELFLEAEKRYEGRIGYWGWQATRESYERALGAADVAVSTARHEFFGIGMAEAAAAGAFPLLPRRLAYPEVFGLSTESGAGDFFHDGTVEGLANALAAAAARIGEGNLWSGDPDRAKRIVTKYGWDRLAPVYDDALASLCISRNSS